MDIVSVAPEPEAFSGAGARVGWEVIAAYTVSRCIRRRFMRFRALDLDM